MHLCAFSFGFVYIQAKYERMRKRNALGLEKGSWQGSDRGNYGTVRAGLEWPYSGEMWKGCPRCLLDRNPTEPSGLQRTLWSGDESREQLREIWRCGNMTWKGEDSKLQQHWIHVWRRISDGPVILQLLAVIATGKVKRKMKTYDRCNVQ